MNAPLDTLAFADRFESAGFDHDQARVLATAFSEVRASARDGLITKADLDLGLSGLEGRLNKQFGDLEGRVRSELASLRVELIREIGTVSKDTQGRLWSTITIVAGTATAISAAISAGVALLLKAGGL